MSKEKPARAFTGELVEFIQQARIQDMPSELIAKARLLCMDLLGVSAKGAQEPASRIARQVMLQQGGEPQAVIIGGECRTGALGAALLNGLAGHALDYDDVDQAMYGHPSVPVLPAALAAAELCRGRRGRLAGGLCARGGDNQQVGLRHEPGALLAGLALHMHHGRHRGHRSSSQDFGFGR